MSVRAQKTPPTKRRTVAALGVRPARSRTFGGDGDGASAGVPAALLEHELQRALNIACCSHADPLGSEPRHLDQVVRAAARRNCCVLLFVWFVFGCMLCDLLLLLFLLNL